MKFQADRLEKVEALFESALFYGHLYTEDLEEVADRLNALFIGVA